MSDDEEAELVHLCYDDGDDADEFDVPCGMR